jgi:hypothetical protein
VGADSRQGARPIDLAGRLALRPPEAAEALGISERKLRQLLPQLPHVRADGVVLIPIDSLRRWLAENARAEQERSEAAVTAQLAHFGVRRRL